MNNKTLAIISYVTILGCLVSYFSIKKRRLKKSFVIYHLKQGLGLGIVHIAMAIVISLVATVFFDTLFILLIIQLIPFVFLIIGIMNVINEKRKPLPIIGKMFESKFSCIG